MKNIYLRILSLVLLVLSSGYISAQCTSSTTYQQQTTCQGTPYNFNGTNVDTAGTYNDTIVLVGGCDSIISLQLFVIPTLYTDIYDTMCAGGTYIFYADTLTAAGVYTQTLYYGTNFCDSVIRLNLAIGTGHNDTFRVSATYCATGGGGPGNGYNFYGRRLNQSGIYVHTASLPGGNSCSDSVVILNLLVGGNTGFTVPTAITVCGSSYNFNGRTLTANGTYNDTLTSSLGCDSIISIRLTLNGTYYQPAATNATICTGGSYVWRGVTYTQPSPGGGPGGGGYKDTVAGVGGCDTIFTLILRAGTSPRVTVRDSFCAGSTYVYGGSSFTVSGRDTVYVPSTAGCDTMVILILSYKAAPTYTYSDSFCQGSTFTYRGHSYTTLGPHFFTVPAPTGCDSVIVVDLSYKAAPTINITDSFCQGTSYTYRGNTYTTSGLQSLTFPAPSGCDTVINLTLRYTTPPNTNLTATICQGQWYVYGVDSFNRRGFYNFTVSTPGQCDSAFTLNLTVTAAPRAFVRDSFCQGGSYTYDGHTFTASGRDTVYAPSPAGCDSMIIINLTYKVPAATPVITQTSNVLVVNPLEPNIQWYLNGTAIAGAIAQTYIASQSGVYSVTTQATGGCQATSANLTLTGVGINETSPDLFKIYPNPSNGKFTIETDQPIGTEIMIFDVLGRPVYQKQLQGNKESIDMSGATNGTYYLEMKNQQHTRYAHFVIAQ